MKKTNTMYSLVCDIFETGGPKNLKEIYQIVLDNGFEDKGDVTRHSIRGIINKLHKMGKIKRVSIATYQNVTDTDTIQ